MLIWYLLDAETFAFLIGMARRRLTCCLRTLWISRNRSLRGTPGLCRWLASVGLEVHRSSYF